MADIPWNNQASLYRTVIFDTADQSQDELLARGTVAELVARFLDLQADQQRGLIVRTATEDDAVEYDESALRELAARPEFLGMENDIALGRERSGTPLA